ncbi:MAG TPA: hypothetical protein IAB39_00010 [Candidatus Onthovicinus excrementipullorum]|nr:hypothetical protein [Candidatus Onthovicinus excrementipullorum]
MLGKERPGEGGTDAFNYHEIGLTAAKRGGVADEILEICFITIYFTGNLKYISLPRIFDNRFVGNKFPGNLLSGIPV